ncbi:carbohydrate ABC transporter permease [Paenirhodobacter sp.]|uniref:carbohydrate ABC transporter permease n=1 Tax=Paenirhodobacter sp. TaxID=1965326 RepID=UPI003B40DEE7
MEQILFATGTILAGVSGCVGWIWGANRVLDLWPGGAILRPWVFLGPALAGLGLYLVWPALETLWRSLHDATGTQWVGAGNYLWLLNDPKFREAMRNTLLWLLVVPTLSTTFGLLAAQLTDRIRWRAVAQAMIFLPMAISFAGAGVIWKFVYDFRSVDQEQIGLLNAVVVAFGGAPRAWLSLPLWNSFCLMAVLIWIQTGFAMVILSAALRAIPQDIREAAMLDGANPWQIFLQITVPQIRGAIAVVWTTITVTVLKVFDIVFVMTNGQWGTQVLANLMYDWMFRGAPDYGRGSAIAVVIMVLVAPVMIWNIRR